MMFSILWASLTNMGCPKSGQTKLGWAKSNKNNFLI